MIWIKREFVCPSCGTTSVFYITDPSQKMWCRKCKIYMNERREGVMVEEEKTQAPQPPQEEEELGLVKPESEFPRGGKVVTGLHNFFEFERKGQMITCLLVGTVTIPNNRDEPKTRYVAVINGEPMVLPDHVDLTRKLEKVFKGTGLGARVVIAYLGREKIKDVATPMMIYEVQEYGKE